MVTPAVGARKSTSLFCVRATMIRCVLAPRTSMEDKYDPDALTVRSYWVLAGWHPPRD
jgi:hypothetical protein